MTAFRVERTMGMLAASALECIRGDRTLFAGVSLAVRPGAGLAVQGANGAGKTSLLRILVGLSPPAHGEVTWGGQPIRSLGADYRREVLWCGHANALKDDLSALENVRAAAALAGRPIAEDAARDALERAGVGAQAALPARSLSQGQKRRTSLARLLFTRARLWVLDEPLAALDASGVEWLAAALDRHLESGGLAVVTSHQPLATRSRFDTLKLGA
jgi:heme exporter protein A